MRKVTFQSLMVMTLNIILFAYPRNRKNSAPIGYLQRCSVFALLLTLVMVVPGQTGAQLEYQGMQPEEFETVLSANSIVRVWVGAQYRQYFDSSASTTHVERGQRATLGSWRIDSNARYCSVWRPSSAEVCYRVERDQQKLLWYTGTGETYLSVVVPVQHLDW